MFKTVVLMGHIQVNIKYPKKIDFPEEEMKKQGSIWCIGQIMAY